MRNLILCVALLLAGCETGEEQDARIQHTLPAGCTIQDIGSYGYVDHVIVVFCNGRQTQTDSYEEHHAKSHTNLSSTQIRE